MERLVCTNQEKTNGGDVVISTSPEGASCCHKGFLYECQLTELKLSIGPDFTVGKIQSNLDTKRKRGGATRDGKKKLRGPQTPLFGAKNRVDKEKGCEKSGNGRDKKQAALGDGKRGGGKLGPWHATEEFFR